MTITCKGKPLRIIGIIQARMESTRLPGKTLLPLASKPLLHHVIERCRRISGIDELIVATGTGAANHPIISLADELNCRHFSGSPDNVLDRYFQCFKKYEGDYVVRITADNPFIAMKYNAEALHLSVMNESDLSSASNLPLGTAVEIIKGTALESAYVNSSRTHHFEHVTPYIKENSRIFRIDRFPVSLDNPFERLRLTVDTDADYLLARHLYDALYHGAPFPLDDVIAHVKDHPDLLNLNASVKQRDMYHTEQ